MRCVVKLKRYILESMVMLVRSRLYLLRSFGVVKPSTSTAHLSGPLWYLTKRPKEPLSSDDEVRPWR